MSQFAYAHKVRVFWNILGFVTINYSAATAWKKTCLECWVTVSTDVEFRSLDHQNMPLRYQSQGLSMLEAQFFSFLHFSILFRNVKS